MIIIRKATVITLVIFGTRARRARIPSLILCLLFLSVIRFFDLHCPFSGLRLLSILSTGMIEFSWLAVSSFKDFWWAAEQGLESGEGRSSKGNEPVEDPSKFVSLLWRANGIKGWGQVGMFAWFRDDMQLMLLSTYELMDCPSNVRVEVDIVSSSDLMLNRASTYSIMLSFRSS